MSKTLVIVLNHNLPELTNWLYYSLRKFQDDTHDILIMDNGSEPQLVPKHAQIKLEQNVFWGGALNKAFEIVLKDKQYDSLMFLNNDIDITPEIFVRSLRHELFHNDFAIVSPCIAGKPMPWRQMQNWGSKTPRIVSWIDNTAPLFHRKIIDAIRKFPDELYIGWGQELICYDVCLENSWRTAVCDYITILHKGKQTLMQKKLAFHDLSTECKAFHAGTSENISWEEFKKVAATERDRYFEAHPLKYTMFTGFAEYGINYTYDG